ncbi:MAG: cytochrome C oxidase subunit IV family protein, partial [Candidatus Wallbacteria bacterium]|nr:cytochrome C oxidase subunit IV family protein [Candidatus Wallbacteria bacterium]
MESTHTHEEPNYMGVFYALVVLTGAELGLSQMTDTFGRTRVVVGLVVLAFTKAAMVALWYMHLKFEGRLLYVVCFAPIVLVCVL